MAGVPVSASVAWAENLKAAMDLHFTHYNFVRFHKTLRCTPAIEAGVVSSSLRSVCRPTTSSTAVPDRHAAGPTRAPQRPTWCSQAVGRSYSQSPPFWRALFQVGSTSSSDYASPHSEASPTASVRGIHLDGSKPWGCLIPASKTLARARSLPPRAVYQKPHPSRPGKAPLLRALGG